MAWTFRIGSSDRRYAYSRQYLFQLSGEPQTQISFLPGETTRPLLSCTISSVDMPPEIYKSDLKNDSFTKNLIKVNKNLAALNQMISVVNIARSSNRQMKRLLMMISSNVAYSTAELSIGHFMGRVGVDGLKFWRPSLMLLLFLLFMSFSLAVKSLHAIGTQCTEMQKT